MRHTSTWILGLLLAAVLIVAALLIRQAYGQTRTSVPIHFRYERSRVETIDAPMSATVTSATGMPLS